MKGGLSIVGLGCITAAVFLLGVVPGLVAVGVSLLLIDWMVTE